MQVATVKASGVVGEEVRLSYDIYSRRFSHSRWKFGNNDLDIPMTMGVFSQYNSYALCDAVTK